MLIIITVRMRPAYGKFSPEKISIFALLYTALNTDNEFYIRNAAGLFLRRFAVSPVWA
jgi:hypothetical protein